MNNRASQKCPECDEDVSGQAKFCPNCGKPLAIMTRTESKFSSSKIEERKILMERKLEGTVSWVKEALRYLRGRKVIGSLLKETKKILNEKQKLEYLISNLESQKGLVSEEMLTSTRNQYTRQLENLENRLHTIEDTLKESRDKIEKEIKGLATELEPFRKKLSEITSLYSSGALSKKDFKGKRRSCKKYIARRERVLKLRENLLKSLIFDHNFQFLPLFKKIWKPAVVILMALFIISLGIWSFLHLKGTQGGIKDVIENIRRANLEEDIDLFMSCYSKEFPNYQDKKKQTLKNWSAYDFEKIDYEIKEKDISDDRAVVVLEWDMKISSQKTQKVKDSTDKLRVFFREEDGNWKVVRVEKDLEKQVITHYTSVSKDDYRILYGKSSHYISGYDGGCKQFIFYEFTGGGMVTRDGSQNVNLNIKKYPTTPPRSKKYDNYYYIHAARSPVRKIQGFPAFDFLASDQTLVSADFKSQKSHPLKSPSASKFPNLLVTSPGNRYLVYVMTTKRVGEFRFTNRDPYKTDSDLIVRNTKSGEEKVVLKGSYNRVLYESFLDFSKEGDALFTITKGYGGFKFVKIVLATGEVIDFYQAFPSFDWSRIPWSEFFKKKRPGFAHFAISPDETKLLVYTYDQRPLMVNACVSDANYKLKSINISENYISTYDQGRGRIFALRWRNNSQEFAYSVISGGGCYPGYLDSVIYKMSRNGKNKEMLVGERRSKILNFGWSPDEKEIAYSVYGMDFVGWIKSVNPVNKEVKKIISTKETEGYVRRDKPIILNFFDWVLIK